MKKVKTTKVECLRDQIQCPANHPHKEGSDCDKCGTNHAFTEEWLKACMVHLWRDLDDAERMQQTHRETTIRLGLTEYPATYAKALKPFIQWFFGLSNKELGIDKEL